MLEFFVWAILFPCVVFQVHQTTAYAMCDMVLQLQWLPVEFVLLVFFWSMYDLTEQLALPAWKLERRSDSLVNSVILWCIRFVCFVCTVAAATVGRSAVPCRGPSKSISHYEPCNWSKQGTECDVCCISFAQRGSCGLCFNTLGVTVRLCQQDSLASFKEVFLQEAYIDDSVYLKYQSYC